MDTNDNAPPSIPANLFGISMVNAALTAQIGFLLQAGINGSDIMNMLVEHVGKVLSLVEPQQLRNEILGQIRRNLSAVVNRYVEARRTTPGGILIPETPTLPGRPN